MSWDDLVKIMFGAALGGGISVLRDWYVQRTTASGLRESLSVELEVNIDTIGEVLAEHSAVIHAAKATILLADRISHRTYEASVGRLWMLRDREQKQLLSCYSDLFRLQKEVSAATRWARDTGGPSSVQSSVEQTIRNKKLASWGADHLKHQQAALDALRRLR